MQKDTKKLSLGVKWCRAIFWQWIWGGLQFSDSHCDFKVEWDGGRWKHSTEVTFALLNLNASDIISSVPEKLLEDKFSYNDNCPKISTIRRNLWQVHIFHRKTNSVTNENKIFQSICTIKRNPCEALNGDADFFYAILILITYFNHKYLSLIDQALSI